MIKLLELSGVIDGVLLRRLGRFVVEVRVGGENLLAHNTNTGRLPNILVPGRRVILVATGSRLRYRLVGVEDVVGSCISVVDVLTQSAAFEKSIELGLLPYFKGCRIIRRNPRIHGSLLDYELSCGTERVVVEMKSAVLRGPNNEAMYPDCQTIRGRKHVRTLIELASLGLKAYLVFVAATCGIRCFKPSDEGDRVVASHIREALLRGIVVKSMSIYMDEQGRIFLDHPDMEICPEFVSEIPGL